MLSVIKLLVHSRIKSGRHYFCCLGFVTFQKLLWNKSVFLIMPKTWRKRISEEVNATHKVHEHGESVIMPESFRARELLTPRSALCLCPHTVLQTPKSLRASRANQYTPFFDELPNIGNHNV